jgi:hypothetical protein
LKDGDCAQNQACVCSSGFVGLTIRQNICAPSSCRSDADCGPDGLCSSAYGGHCGSPSGYHCRKAADTCRVQADCAKASDGGLSAICDYAPEEDRWQCRPVVACGG